MGHTQVLNGHRKLNADATFWPCHHSNLCHFVQAFIDFVAQNIAPETCAVDMANLSDGLTIFRNEKCAWAENWENWGWNDAQVLDAVDIIAKIAH